VIGNAFPGGPDSLVASIVRSILSWYGSTIKIPVYEHAPLLLPPSADLPRWPLVVFSHGLGGTRTTYSTLCAHLAAQGRIVIAIEHRDGTGPAVFPGGKKMPYIVPDEVVWPEEEPEEEWMRGVYNSERSIRFRKEQLDFRRREIYETLHSIGLLSSGQIQESGLQALESESFDLSRWTDRVNCEEVDLVGHSFGGATIVGSIFV
jgi:platelet-activating factor acetylhydrolase